ncbi:MAG: TonB family protein [Bacteroidia bacterium]
MLRHLCILLILACMAAMPARSFAQAEAEANDRSRVDEPPIPLNLPEVKAQIGYPQLAVKTLTQGRVVVKLLISDEGAYIRHTLTDQPNPMLAQAVEARIAELKFKPAVFNGRRIDCWVTIPFEFELKQEGTTGQSGKREGVFYSLDSAMAQSGRVTHLFLDNQNLDHFPMEVLGFPELRVLELGGNHIKELPDEIVFLPSLEYLGLGDNELMDLPRMIWTLPSLRSIFLRGNAIPVKTQRTLEQSHGGQIEPKALGRVVW